MNAPRLRGQIVFEYGTLLRAIDSWAGLRVLDIGTGRSTFPRWMSRAGAAVTTFDLGDAGRAGRRRLSRTRRSARQAPARASAGGRRFDALAAVCRRELRSRRPPCRSSSTSTPICRRGPMCPTTNSSGGCAEVLDEMIRVTRPGGYLYVTSECCDYEPRHDRQLARRLLLRRRSRAVGGLAGARRPAAVLRLRGRSRLHARRRPAVRPG